MGVIPLNVIAKSQNNGVGVKEQVKDVPRYAPDEYVKEILDMDYFTIEVAIAAFDKYPRD